MSYANEGNKSYWEAVKAGEIEHKGRGKDQKARAPKDKKSFEKRYYDRTGRSILQDMQSQIEEIEMMKEIALSINNPEDKFAALKEVNMMRDKYNRQWAPYLVSKLGHTAVQTVAEEEVSLDDVLAGRIAGGPDETH